jgi:single-strand DNA-binding protein
MPYMNHVELMGHVGGEVRVKVFDNGDKVADFGLATTEKWRKGDEWQERTTWHNVKGNKFAADAIEKLEKGDLVLVEGKINTEEWKTKEGEKRSKTVIKADKVHFLRHKGGHGEATQGSGNPDDPDLPF